MNYKLSGKTYISIRMNMTKYTSVTLAAKTRFQTIGFSWHPIFQRNPRVQICFAGVGFSSSCSSWTSWSWTMTRTTRTATLSPTFRRPPGGPALSGDPMGDQWGIHGGFMAI